MNKCLVSKLSSVVNNDNLAYLDSSVILVGEVSKKLFMQSNYGFLLSGEGTMYDRTIDPETPPAIVGNKTDSNNIAVTMGSANSKLSILRTSDVTFVSIGGNSANAVSIMNLKTATSLLTLAIGYSYISGDLKTFADYQKEYRTKREYLGVTCNGVITINGSATTKGTTYYIHYDGDGGYKITSDQAGTNVIYNGGYTAA